jgi:hypothetical protein
MSEFDWHAYEKKLKAEYQDMLEQARAGDALHCDHTKVHDQCCVVCGRVMFLEIVKYGVVK